MTRAEFIAGYERQYIEWAAIRDEMFRDASIKDGTCQVSVTAYQVTLEQRKRLMARGERMLTYEDLVASEV